MSGTTITIPEELRAALERASRRMRLTVEETATELLRGVLAGVSSEPGDESTSSAGGNRSDLAGELDGASRRSLPFANLGASGHHDTSVVVEEILADAWGRRGDTRDS